MVFKNYLTTPSGKYCEVEELKNEDYFIMLKYLQANDYKNFFKSLDEVVSKNIPHFSDFDIVDKCYVYIAVCMYSVRGSIEVNNPKIGPQEISLGLMLDNIEKSYPICKKVNYSLSDKIELNFVLPKKFVFNGDLPIIDFYSGLVGYNNKIIDNDQIEKLKSVLNTKQKLFIESTLRDSYDVNFDLFDGVMMNSYKMNLLSEQMIGNVISFYRMDLEYYYHMMYAIIKHLRMSYSDFMKITNIETTILLKHVAEENKSMSENAKKGDIGTIGRAMSDEF